MILEWNWGYPYKLIAFSILRDIDINIHMYIHVCSHASLSAEKA